ncbi:MAG TPA: GNAT family N-acetyltransferase [Thermoanaerobaculia bacterium]|nr:GNAT family N-acetyltransferase [Thermoanaerobaculia bacterium]
MIRTASTGDLDSIRTLLEGANDMPYDIAPVVEEKCFGEGLSGPPRVRVVEEDGAIRAVAVTCGKYLRILAVDRNHRRRGIGTALLEDSAAEVIAAEPGNYCVPGVIDPAFFAKRGYRQTGETWNLHVEIRDSGFGVRELRTPNPELRTAMLAFIAHNFNPAWAFEANRAVIAHYLPNIGFAVAEANNRGQGTFGPAGVVESARGRGYGRQLLMACLADLHRLGYTRAIIPWTDAIEFYRKSCGAEAAHRFVRLAKPL